MNCPICSQSEWENIDQYRLKKADMCMCKSCGFVTYPKRYEKKEELKEYYKKEYRPAPLANALFTGERKLQYHAHFLSNLFKKWKDENKTKPVIGEIGSAYGLFLNWVRQNFPEGDINGTELTESYKRVAFHEFGLKLKDELPNKKYDLIASYHVLEHIFDPDKELDKYYDLLNDDGIFYLSVPVWFREAINSAQPGFDIEIHWAEDHVNAWTEEHLEHLLNKHGFEIVFKDTVVYGNTYLLKKKEKNKSLAFPKTDYKEYRKKAKALYDCYLHLQEHKTAEAIESWPNCPTAWMSHYEFNRSKFHKDQEGLFKFLEQAKKACLNSPDIKIFVADVLVRYEKYKEALIEYDEALKTKPNNDTILIGIANCYRMLGMKTKDQNEKKDNLKKSINILRFLMNISTQNIPNCISWSYHDQSHLPID